MVRVQVREVQGQDMNASKSSNPDQSKQKDKS
jgi:hypothetical protein